MANLIIDKMDFDDDINVSVFETNIRGTDFHMTLPVFVVLFLSCCKEGLTIKNSNKAPFWIPTLCRFNS